MLFLYCSTLSQLKLEFSRAEHKTGDMWRVMVCFGPTFSLESSLAKKKIYFHVTPHTRNACSLSPAPEPRWRGEADRLRRLLPAEPRPGEAPHLRGDALLDGAGGHHVRRAAAHGVRLKMRRVVSFERGSTEGLIEVLFIKISGDIFFLSLCDFWLIN